uniref:Autotransporter domain-containing protein n=1 Tax=Panagrolaimus sp. ES5 TaxID=591445 RepID=A0AC34F0E2_9BILA
MLRYYLSNTQVNSSLKHGRFLLEGNAGIGGTNITKGGNSTIGISLGFGSGYAYFITPNIAIEGLVKYNGDFGFGNIGTTSNIGFNVGFQIYLPTTKLKDITHDMQQKNIN